MACLGMQIVSFGGVSEVTIRQLRRSVTVVGDHRRRLWRNPRMCLDNLGKIQEGLAVDGTLRLSWTELKSGSRQKKPMASPQLDQLMKESVTEIVKNINEAPFLAQIYSEDMNNDENRTPLSSPLRLVIGKATSETWPYITESWESGGNSTPDSVILVEELSSTERVTSSSTSNGGCCTRNEGGTPSSAKVWGLVVQGRGVSYPACYILKTCQVQCCFGYSTHFCLAKVDCFGQDSRNCGYKDR
ncbi:hypothetical protein V2J09_006538 [Rumex salicifolius]